MGRVPDLRIRQLNSNPVRGSGRFVLYWMIAARRPGWNFALQRAVEWAVELQKPLLILEAVRTDYPWASDRFHRFIMDGMLHHQEAFSETRVRYYPYVEKEKGAGKGLLAALSGESCVVVTDEFPCFTFPDMVTAAAKQVGVHLEEVDGNGLLPLRAVDRTFLTAYAFRRVLQQVLPRYLGDLPGANPLAGVDLASRPAVPRAILDRWPPARPAELAGSLDHLPVDHSVSPVRYAGGAKEGKKRLRRFLTSGIDAYEASANQPESEATSRLSPYLHFGNISSHQVFQSIVRREGWTRDRLSGKTGGRRRGWWGMSEASEAFLDQLVTWRELGFNYCSRRKNYTRYESLPPWALETLELHSADRREYTYAREEFEQAQTHDPLWNAAQNQLRVEGHIHNYLRMLWGKKILEWSSHPSEAMQVMIELNDKYAVDGRDPNSYSGISWVLGRYDRPWGPERPIFGKVRYMSSANTARKLRVKDYIRSYVEASDQIDG
jgi:deoxyribodipyrimidine photo-lyase